MRLDARSIVRLVREPASASRCADQPNERTRVSDVGWVLGTDQPRLHRRRHRRRICRAQDEGAGD